MKKLRIIAAVSSNGVIGKDNKIPFHYPEDLKRFKAMTLGSIVIMGRKTFESIGRRLPQRRNVIISSTMKPKPGIKIFPTIEEALNYYFNDDRDIWFIGGEKIYEQSMQYVHEIYLTITPDIITGDNLAKFPWINSTQFHCENRYCERMDNLLFMVYSKTTSFKLKNGLFITAIGDKKWYFNDELHRSNAHAYINNTTKTKHWHNHGVLSREDGPAIEDDDSREWWLNGVRHNSCGPAIIWCNGDKEWLVNGKYHRDDGPAIEYKEVQEWWKDDKIHRLDGPAIEYSDGRKEWVYEGKKIDCSSQEEFARLIKLKAFW